MTSHIERRRGDNAPDQVTFNQDITGISFRLTINSLGAPETQATQILQMTGVTIDAVSGIVQFAPSQAEANALQPGCYYYDVQAYSAFAGLVHTACTGTYDILQDITKEVS